MGRKQNILIVGAGFSGSVIARELAEAGFSITVIDQRNHIAGNCYDEIIGSVKVHKYGPHLFHTNNKKVVDWLSKFTDWIEYKHKVKALYKDQFLTVPPNKQTKEYLGDKLFEVIYKPYSEKMWGVEVDDSILDRVKPRDDDNEYYFPNDKYQFLPKEGYTKLFENILDHNNIKVVLNTKFHKDMETNYDHIFNSMPIDLYYEFCFGELPYRSIKFHHTICDQQIPVMNYTDNGKYTRITKWELFPNHGKGALSTLEEPCDYKDNNDERYYPVKDKEGVNREIYNKYAKIENKKTTFIGRCGKYVYLDMDMAVSSAIALANKFKNENL